MKLKCRIHFSVLSLCLLCTGTSADHQTRWKVTAGEEWLPLEFKRETVKGSILDFSFLQDAPAGKYGFVRVSPAGTFSFENAPQKRIRFYGVNLCFSANFLTRDEVDKLAETLVRCGYNAIRIHHHDTEMLDRDSADSITLDREKLDALDYLVFRMKKSGIYVTTDLYTNREFRPGDHVAEAPAGGRHMKALLPISSTVFENWKTFVRRWMSHRNPYTGLTWAEEPALFCINLVNEDPLWNIWQSNKTAAELYRKHFETWKKEHGHPNAAAARADRRFRQFLQELQEKRYLQMKSFLRNELGMRTLITGLNLSADIPLALSRARIFDLTDIHGYYDPPDFAGKKWSLPYRFKQTSAISEFASVPRWMLGARVFGQPMIVTEFNYCAPNRWRAEAGPLIGGYAALQDWDGLFRFAWSHGSAAIRHPSGSIYGFDAVNDPLAQLSDKIAILLFRRGDVSPAKQKIAWNVNNNFFDGSGMVFFPRTFGLLGLFAQVGTSLNENPPDGAEVITGASANKPGNMKSRSVRRFWERLQKEATAISDTDEIRLNPSRRQFSVCTPCAESLTLDGGDLDGNNLHVKNAIGFQTLALFSMDGKEIAESSRLLLIHLTDVLGSGAVFDTPDRKLLFWGGKQPLLVKRGKADVRVPTGPYRISALNADGAVLGCVTGQTDGAFFHFTVDTGLFPGGVTAYELRKEK